jgi:hypothetical protein
MARQIGGGRSRLKPKSVKVKGLMNGSTNGVDHSPESGVLASLASDAAKQVKSNANAQPSSGESRRLPTAVHPPIIVPWSAPSNESTPNAFVSFLKDAKSKYGQQATALWGMTTADVRARTAMTAADFQRAIAIRPGYDLYVCSPAPELEALYPNLWSHLQVAIPKFQPTLRSVFKTLRWDIDQLLELQPSVTFSTSHYYIGSSKFWNSYCDFLQETITDITERGTKSANRFLHQSAATGPAATATHWSLFTDRLLPVFLRLKSNGLKVARIPIPAAEQKLNTHLKKLREMKDVAHHTKSQWLASCWLHYRNTYLLNVAGRDWCQRNLPLMTPSDIRFY